MAGVVLGLQFSSLSAEKRLVRHNIRLQTSHRCLLFGNVVAKRLIRQNVLCRLCLRWLLLAIVAEKRLIRVHFIPYLLYFC